MRVMTKNAALRYAREKIRVNSIHPGFIDTPMIAPFLKDEAGNRSRMAQWIEAMTRR